MDESHTSVKENGERKVIVLMAVPWGAEIRLSSLTLLQLGAPRVGAERSHSFTA